MVKNNFLEKYGMIIGVGLVALVIILIIVFSGGDEKDEGPFYSEEDIGSVRTTLRLNGDFNEIGERDQFEENFRNDLSGNLQGVNSEQIIIKGITEGSINVEFIIVPQSDDLNEEELTSFQNEISRQLQEISSNSELEITGSTINVIDESDISVVTSEFIDLIQGRSSNDGVAETTVTRDCQGEWGDWDVCSAECGGGTQQRSYIVSRTKLGNGAACSNTDGETQERACNTDACIPCQGEWSEYGGCSAECGGGTQQREYTVTREAGPGGESCSNETGDTEEIECNTAACIPCQGGWGAWGNCNRQCGGGVQEKTYTVTREAGPGGESCDHSTGEKASRGCNTQACEECEGRWYNPLATDPTAFMQGCSVSCGGGTLTERYEITNPGEPGGTPCEANDGDERSVECNTQACSNIYEENVPIDHVPTTDCRHLQRSDKVYDVDALNACMNSISPTGRTYTENTENWDCAACDDYGYPREDTIISYEVELNPTSTAITPYCKHHNSWDRRKDTKLMTELCQLWGHNSYDLAYIQNQPDTNVKATGNTQGKWPPHHCQITDSSGNFIPYVAKRQSSVHHKQIDSIKCN